MYHKDVWWAGSEFELRARALTWSHSRGPPLRKKLDGRVDGWMHGFDFDLVTDAFERIWTGIDQIWAAPSQVGSSLTKHRAVSRVGLN